MRPKTKLETGAPIESIEEAVRSMLDGLTRKASQPTYKANEGRIHDFWALCRLSACAEVLRLAALHTQDSKQRQRLNDLASEVTYLWSKFESPMQGIEPLRPLLNDGARAWLWNLRKPKPDPFVVGANQARQERERAALEAEAAALEAAATEIETKRDRAKELRERAAAI